MHSGSYRNIDRYPLIINQLATVTHPLLMMPELVALPLYQITTIPRCRKLCLLQIFDDRCRRSPGQRQTHRMPGIPGKYFLVALPATFTANPTLRWLRT